MVSRYKRLLRGSKPEERGDFIPTINIKGGHADLLKEGSRDKPQFTAIFGNSTQMLDVKNAIQIATGHQALSGVSS
jgi:hypothetical protein